MTRKRFTYPKHWTKEEQESYDAGEAKLRTIERADEIDKLDHMLAEKANDEGFNQWLSDSEQAIEYSCDNLRRELGPLRPEPTHAQIQDALDSVHLSNAKAIVITHELTLEEARHLSAWTKAFPQSAEWTGWDAPALAQLEQLIELAQAVDETKGKLQAEDVASGQALAASTADMRRARPITPSNMLVTQAARASNNNKRKRLALALLVLVLVMLAASLVVFLATSH